MCIFVIFFFTHKLSFDNVSAKTINDTIYVANYIKALEAHSVTRTQMTVIPSERFKVIIRKS